MNEDYFKGYKDGYREGLTEKLEKISEWMPVVSESEFRSKGGLPKKKPSNRKRNQSKKQKLLTSMTAKKWKTYSKGSGRKTYVEIRSQVSRSKAYKSKAKKL